ncbi:MAG: hypothetical protein UV12_C0014G0013 [Candidatus Nomurabacteria bacterium GW2011_GWC2_42_20]|uniref:Uncharacterized protein n=1 Tax=Candidatus Nomurabacteria bacterium GW2011_GWC2_42_20 TaxID=1618756 RepID=A0A0G0ZE10_9BACT|nr:MAG: hypothetical protein UV12_C0014G0013 [Candidatus Nomurabacteria bacterium GW2011_GWC2_42_20]
MYVYAPPASPTVRRFVVVSPAAVRAPDFVCAVELVSRNVLPAGGVAPAGPCGPVAPVAPVAPTGPCAPVAPVAPVAPAGPCAPVAPVAPVAPAGPSYSCAFYVSSDIELLSWIWNTYPDSTRRINRHELDWGGTGIVPEPETAVGIDIIDIGGPWG